jgi:hypothetical protein
MDEKLLVLTRMETSDEGTFGKLRVGDLRLYSGELPWRENAPNISCIPPGDYPCVPYQSKRFGQCFAVENVPGRFGILIHPANLVGAHDNPEFQTELEGCIAPGKGRGFLAGQDAVTSSRVALSELMDELWDEPFTLRIIDETGGRCGGDA